MKPFGISKMPSNFLDRARIAAVQRFAEQVDNEVERIALFPESGRIVPETGKPGLREVLIGDYRLVYSLEEDPLEIVTIFHAARQFPIIRP